MTTFQVPVLNLDNPTDPQSYRNMGPVSGAPLNWQDDITGRMKAAVMAYLDQKPTADQLRIVICYIQHHIHAPCWLETPPWGEVDKEMADEIRALRALSLKLKTTQDVNRFINRALKIAIDPL